uniref:3-deoxy-D-manno-octulosonic-acid transferase N-terminal domain-containing protein n=1 Tax=Globisporangium ultimum (strain ATCC 200006 / CBS 805.95 / DAOM BR144) TaxID=431595 RepID=K3X8G7_GLOUD
MELLVHRAYCGIWRAAEPLVAWYIKRKDLRRGVLPAFTAERFGVSKLPAEWKQHAKGEYFTLWIHGASVGECLSALPLIEMLLAEPFALEMKTTTVVSDGALSTPRQKARIVLTTTTPAARQLLNSRLASITLKTPCIFAPMDHPDWVKRFYDTWQPDAGLWIESELWPNLIHEATTRQFRIGILNGRISERSFRRWQLPVLNSFAHSLVSPFSMVLCQNEQQRRNATVMQLQ